MKHQELDSKCTGSGLLKALLFLFVASTVLLQVSQGEKQDGRLVGTEVLLFLLFEHG